MRCRCPAAVRNGAEISEALSRLSASEISAQCSRKMNTTMPVSRARTPSESRVFRREGAGEADELMQGLLSNFNKKRTGINS